MNIRRRGLPRWGRRSIPSLTAAIPLVLFGLVGGCINQPKLLPARDQQPIDKSVIEYPSGFVLTRIAAGLNCPTAICFDEQGSMLVAESGVEGYEPHIFGYHKDGSYFQIYPYKRYVSLDPTGFRLYGPVGGMVFYQGRLYVTHRDRDGYGVVTALDYEGGHATVIGKLPARGDFGVSDIAVGPKGRLYFTVGTATNSGVVGLDNAWLKRYPDVHDEFFTPNGGSIALLGYRFDSPNPLSGFLQPEIAVTGPGQRFNESIQSHLRPSERPNGAVYSVRTDGGEPEIQSDGFGNVRGIAFDDFGHPFVAHDGMQARGSRAILNDPDTVIAVFKGVWMGWPDYTTNGHPVTDPEYRPPLSYLTPFGYDALSQLIDRDASGLHLPDDFNVLVAGIFPSLSGASKMTFVPADGPFKAYAGNLLVALDGDRAPFATGGMKLLGPVGFKVAIVDVGSKQVRDFVHNTANTPASRLPYGTVGLERPCDVKFGPDGSLYILDFGQMENNGPTPRYHSGNVLSPGTGAIFKLAPIAAGSK